MFVKDWMSSTVVRGAPEMTRAEARRLMETRFIRRLPVVAQGRLVGIVTLNDVNSSRPGDLVSDIMTRDPIYVVPDETLERAALMMLNRRISGLPVIDGDDVVGIITETDVFRALVDMLGLHDTGARIVLTLKSPEGLLDELRARTGTMVVRSLVTYHDPHSKEWKAVVRLRGRVPQQNPAPQPGVPCDAPRQARSV